MVFFGEISRFWALDGHFSGSLTEETLDKGYSLEDLR